MAAQICFRYPNAMLSVIQRGPSSSVFTNAPSAGGGRDGTSGLGAPAAGGTSGVAPTRCGRELSKTGCPHTCRAGLSVARSILPAMHAEQQGQPDTILGHEVGGRDAAFIDPKTRRTFGDVVPSRSLSRSKAEEQVRDFLAQAGYRLRGTTVGVLCRHPDAGKTFLTLTPDILFRGVRLAVEVDPCGPTSSSRGWTHTGDEDKDRLRNDMLEAVGWTVIRLRLGAREGGHIGDRDVVAESSTFTLAAQQALIAAIEDYLADRTGQVRVVRKGKTPAPAKRRSSVARIVPDRYCTDAHWFHWYPDLNKPDKVSLRLSVGGRYLYDSERLFVAEVGLHEVEPEQWKERLAEVLAGQASADVVGTTQWPWGPTLLVCPTTFDAPDSEPDGAAAREIVAACERRARGIDTVEFSFTVSGEEVSYWNEVALQTADHEPVVALHPAALDAGYRITSVAAQAGPYGPYRRITVARL